MATDIDVNINSTYEIDVETSIDGQDITVVFQSLAQTAELNGELSVDFDYNDFTTGSLAIGTVPINKRIEMAVVVVTTVFDDGAQCTIGDAIAQGRFATISESDLATVNVYTIEIHNYEYSVATELSIYFPVGSPTTGTGTAIIYYR